MNRRALDIGMGVWAVGLVGLVGAVAIFDKDPATSAASARLPSATSASRVVNHGWTFDKAKTALAKEAPTVLVLGDSTGYAEKQWASLWAHKIGEGRGVSYHSWDWRENSGYVTPNVEIPGSRKVTFWNGSKPGATADYQSGHWDKVGKKADLVILNFGHNGGDDTAAQDAALSGLLEKVLKQSPNAVVVGTAQNPEKGDQNKAKREAVKAWDDTHGLPTIDVNAAFVADGRGDKLRRDDVHPNDDGSQVWEAAVVKVLGTGS